MRGSIGCRDRRLRPGRHPVRALDRPAAVRRPEPGRTARAGARAPRLPRRARFAPTCRSSSSGSVCTCLQKTPVRPLPEAGRAGQRAEALPRRVGRLRAGRRPRHAAAAARRLSLRAASSACARRDLALAAPGFWWRGPSGSSDPEARCAGSKRPSWPRLPGWCRSSIPATRRWPAASPGMYAAGTPNQKLAAALVLAKDRAASPAITAMNGSCKPSPAAIDPARPAAPGAAWPTCRHGWRRKSSPAPAQGPTTEAQDRRRATGRLRTDRPGHGERGMVAARGSLPIPRRDRS